MNAVIDPLMVGMAAQISKLTRRAETAENRILSLQNKVAMLSPVQTDIVVDIHGVDVGVNYLIEMEDGTPYAVVTGFYLGPTDIGPMLSALLGTRDMERIEAECMRHAKRCNEDAQIDAYISAQEARL